MKRIAIGGVLLILGLSALSGADDTQEAVRAADSFEYEPRPVYQAERDVQDSEPEADVNNTQQSYQSEEETLVRTQAEVPTYESIESEPEPAQSDCHPGYSGCLKRYASDYDCAGGSGNGPYYTGQVRVYGSDPFGLDRDNDGWGCE